MLLTRVRMYLQHKLPWYLMFKILGSWDCWKFDDVFKTELTYATTLCLCVTFFSLSRLKSPEIALSRTKFLPNFPKVALSRLKSPKVTAT